MRGWQIYVAYWWTRVWRPTAHRRPPDRQPLAIRRYKALTQPRDEWLRELRSQPLPPREAPPRRETPRRESTPPRVPTQRRPPTGPPTNETFRSQHVWITTQESGLLIRRRAGYTGWLEVCDLRWADISAMELDSGTHDAARMLYASTRSSPMRTPLIDQAHLTNEQWYDLRDSIAAWTQASVLIDLAPLGPIDRSRPYEEL
jgi:hypothetical protein